MTHTLSVCVVGPLTYATATAHIMHWLSKISSAVRYHTRGIPQRGHVFKCPLQGYSGAVLSWAACTPPLVTNLTALSCRDAQELLSLKLLLVYTAMCRKRAILDTRELLVQTSLLLLRSCCLLSSQYSTASLIWAPFHPETLRSCSLFSSY